MQGQSNLVTKYYNHDQVPAPTSKRVVQLYGSNQDQRNSCCMQPTDCCGTTGSGLNSSKFGQSRSASRVTLADVWCMFLNKGATANRISLGSCSSTGIDRNNQRGNFVGRRFWPSHTLVRIILRNNWPVTRLKKIKITRLIHSVTCLSSNVLWRIVTRQTLASTTNQMARLLNSSPY
jgi:hypothetical protein